MMRIAAADRFLVAVLLWCGSALVSCAQTPQDQAPKKMETPPQDARLPGQPRIQAAAKDLPASSAYERVENAQFTGELSAKDAVLLKARLLFAPQTMPESSPFRPRAGEPIFREPGRTLFYKEVHIIFPKLTESEREWLKTLNPDLKAIVTQRQIEEKNPASKTQ